MQELNFDVVIHLAGEQIIPNYIGVKLCTSPRHILVVTDKTDFLAERLKQQCETDLIKFFVSKVPAYDYVQIKRSFDSAAQQAKGRRVGFNVTGGTKPMFAAAIDFCRENGAFPFYIDSTQRKVRFLHEPFASLPMPPVFQSVSEFIKLAGYRVQHEGKNIADPELNNRTKLADLFWRKRDLVRRWIADFSKATDKKYQNSKNMPDFFKTALDEMLQKTQEQTNGELNREWETVFPEGSDWRPAAVFAAGGWFEEYCFWQLKPLLDAGKIKDLRLGCAPTWSDQPYAAGKFSNAQEFDICFTDGYDLTICECKAGQLKQEYIQKLENIRANFGGSFGHAVLLSINKPDIQTAQRIKQQKAVSMLSGKHLNNVATQILTIKPGTVMEDSPTHPPQNIKPKN